MHSLDDVILSDMRDGLGEDIKLPLGMLEPSLGEYRGALEDLKDALETIKAKEEKMVGLEADEETLILWMKFLLAVVFMGLFFGMRWLCGLE